MDATRLLNFLSIFLPIFFITGCTQPLNDRPTLGGSYVSPTFRKKSQPAIPLDSPTEHLLANTPKPRSAWTPTQYIAPFDGVVHGHTFTLRAPMGQFTYPRIYGLYPTTLTSLDPQSTPWIKQLWHSCNELGRSFLGSDFSVLSLTFTGQLTKPVTSPTLPWKRTDTHDAWSSGFPVSPNSTQNPNEDLADD